MNTFFIILVVVMFALYAVRELTKKPKAEQQNVQVEPVKEVKPTPKRFDPKDLSKELRNLYYEARNYLDYDVYHAIEKGTYDGPTWLPKYDDMFIYDIKGINYRTGISKYVYDGPGYLQPSPRNRHDPNAIKVMSEDGHHLGFVDKDYTSAVRELTNNQFPYPIKFSIHEEEDYDNRHFYYGTFVIKRAPKETNESTQI